MAAGRAMQQKECDESVGSLVVGKKEARTKTTGTACGYDLCRFGV